MELDETLEKLNKVKFNLDLVKKKWDELRELLAYPVEGNWDHEGKEEYLRKCLEFMELLTKIPSIRGLKIEEVLPDYDEVSQGSRDYRDLGEVDAFTSFISDVFEQGSEISKYEHFLNIERGKLVRNQLLNYIKEVNNILSKLKVEENEEKWSDPADPDIIHQINEKVSQIEVLMGESIKLPSRWGDLNRHLYFGQIHDLNDIIIHDWPSITSDLRSSLQAEEPFEIDIEDLGNLVDNSNKSGQIGIHLKWDAITYDNFERLCADLLESLPEWENVEWLTPTNASDRGRDITAFWVSHTTSRGTIRERAIIQCKHRPNKSVSAKDIEAFQNLSLLHDNVDLYLLITSGKFSDQAIQIVEKQNQTNNKPHVEVWEHWKLEKLLASYPNLIKIYGLD